jgi:group I intron endonuclease
VLKRTKSHVYSALLKHGYSNFRLEILEYCSASEVLERENYYLKLFNPSYNILDKAGSSLGYRHSEETKEKNQKKPKKTKKKHGLLCFACFATKKKKTKKKSCF